MMQTVVCLLAFLAAQVLGMRAPLPDYGVEEFVWGVDVYQNGTIIEIPGPVENVYAQIQNLNPDLAKSVANSITADTPDLESTTTTRTNILFQNEQQAVHCGASIYNWGSANLARIWDGVGYLKGVPGQPVRGPGPGNCGRVSCSWKAAIWWCNDKKDASNVLPGFWSIADCAEDLCNTCKSGELLGDETCVGQNFVSGDWNCVVRYDDDSC